MITQSAVHAISGPKAAELAKITYRQLDYWARQGWVKPSVGAGVGRPGRRIYGPEDVVRLAALGHFGRSGADVGQLGQALSGLTLAGAPDDYLLVASGSGMEIVAASNLRARVSQHGSTVVFDPAGVLSRMRQGQAASGPAARRSA